VAATSRQLAQFPAPHCPQSSNQWRMLDDTWDGASDLPSFFGPREAPRLEALRTLAPKAWRFRLLEVGLDWPTLLSRSLPD
jgi:hypothetical protein